jgi:hypothetical protein
MAAASPRVSARAAVLIVAFIFGFQALSGGFTADIAEP